jgi:ribonuclease BN (tRNA processing enzyme)
MALNEPTATPRFDEACFGLLVLGTGGLFSTRYYHTSFLVVAGARRIQIDLPSPYFKILAEAAREVGLEVSTRDVEDFVVTHVHGDHSNGCEEVGLFKRFIEKTRPRLHLLPEVVEPLWRHKLSASMGAIADESLTPLPPTTLETYFDVRTVTPEAPTRIGDVTLSVRRTRHAVPCFASKLERAGRRIGISGDTLYDPGLIEWFGDCDLILHEAATGGPHTQVSRLAELDPALKRKMVLIHLSDDFVCDDPWLRIARQGGFYQLA